jgi:hypothetical protein
MVPGFAGPITDYHPNSIILPYNFVSPIILNTFAAIAVALAKAIIDRRSFSEGEHPSPKLKLRHPAL